MMIGDRYIGEDLEGNIHGLIEILFHHLPEGTEENQEEPWDNRVQAEI
jgi:hypothetical protein